MAERVSLFSILHLNQRGGWGGDLDFLEIATEHPAGECCRESTLPKVFVRKRSARSGLQVLFESGCTLIVIESDRSYNAPRRVLGRMWGAALIVSGQSLLEVIRQSYVSMIGLSEAFEEVDVFHRRKACCGLAGCLALLRLPRLRLGRLRRAAFAKTPACQPEL